MGLSCGCDYGDGDFQWYWEAPDDYSTLDTKRYRRCKSCGEIIRPGDTVARFVRYRYTNDAVEINIYGEDGQIPLASWYHCEDCADQFFNLHELGFCFQVDENMRDLVREYAAMRNVRLL